MGKRGQNHIKDPKKSIFTKQKFSHSTEGTEENRGMSSWGYLLALLGTSDTGCFSQMTTGTVAWGCQRFTGKIRDELIGCRQLLRLSVLCHGLADPGSRFQLISGQSWGEFYLLTLKVSGCRSIIASVPRQT